MSDEPDAAMLNTCLAAMARLNAANELAATIRRLASARNATEQECELAMIVLVTSLLDLTLSRGAAPTANFVLGRNQSRWRLVRLDG